MVPGTGQVERSAAGDGLAETPARSPATSGVATRKRPPTLTANNQVTRKLNLALNAEMKEVAERLTLRGTDPRRPQVPL
jgi:hypothetical protein